MQLAQVGELESSKSAMNTRAPELSALITILRSTGPVISTRRSAISSGVGATRQSPARMSAVSGRKSGSSPRMQALEPLCPPRQQLDPARAERALQIVEEAAGIVGEDVCRVGHGVIIPFHWRGSRRAQRQLDRRVLR